MGRGGYNLAYNEGFMKEIKTSRKFWKTYKKLLKASALETCARGLADQVAGIDAWANIEGHLYGISLRHREVDYGSFTLNRHLSDKASELVKWRKSMAVRPYYHIQSAPSATGECYIFIVVNVPAFTEYTYSLNLEEYYNAGLKAYEFKLSEFVSLRCVRSYDVTI